MRCYLKTDESTLRQMREVYKKANAFVPYWQSGSLADRVWHDAKQILMENAHEPTPEQVFRYGFELGKVMESGNQRSRWVAEWDKIEERTALEQRDKNPKVCGASQEESHQTRESGETL